MKDIKNLQEMCSRTFIVRKVFFLNMASGNSLFRAYFFEYIIISRKVSVLDYCRERKRKELNKLKGKRKKS